MSSALFLSAMLVAAAGRPDLSGTVTNAYGRPISAVKVSIYEAHPRRGTSSCVAHAYPDCQKETMTDRRGRFRIASLDPNLLFRVLILPDHHDPMFAELVDPAAGPLKVIVSRRRVYEIDPRRVIRGRVLDIYSQPVAGAMLTLVEGRTDGRRPHPTTKIDSTVISNVAGDFVVTATGPIVDAVYRVQARGWAPRLSAKLSPDRFAHTVTLSPGTPVTGRVVHQGRPVPEVTVAIRHADRNPTGWVGQMVISTDRQGRFRFDHVPCRRSYHVFAKAQSVKHLGAVAVRQVQLDSSGTETDLGDLQVQPGDRIQGQVKLAGSARLPENARLLITNTTTTDTLSILLRPDGRFTAAGLPPGFSPSDYTLRVSLPGHALSPKNPTVDLNYPLPLQDQLAGGAARLAIALEPPGPSSSPAGLPQPADSSQSADRLISDGGHRPAGAIRGRWESKRRAGGTSIFIGAEHHAAIQLRP